MTDRLEIRITGTNQSSQAFQQVSRDAQQMGTSVEQASTRGGRSMDDFNRRSAALGAAVGSAALLMGEFARSAAEEEVVFARLQQSIEATGRSFVEYEDAINQAISRGQELSFSDDQIADALGRMTTTTGSAQAALDNLGVAMDFARARGVDLSTAADLIGRAYTGNTQTLARYGIQIDKNATSTEALAAIQAKTAGQAEAYAATTSGSFDRIKNSIDDATESLGGYANELTVAVALLPGLSVGWAAVSGAVGGLTGALGGAGGATAAVTGFGAAMGAAAATAAVFAPAIGLVAYTAYTARDNLKAVTTETEKLNESLAKLGEPEGGYMDRVFGAFSQNMSLIEVTIGNTTQTLESSFDELVALEGEFALAFRDVAIQAGIDWSIPLDQQADKVAFLIDQVHYFYGLQRQMMVDTFPNPQGMFATGTFPIRQATQVTQFTGTSQALGYDPYGTSTAGQNNAVPYPTSTARQAIPRGTGQSYLGVDPRATPEGIFGGTQGVANIGPLAAARGETVDITFNWEINAEEAAAEYEAAMQRMQVSTEAFKVTQDLIIEQQSEYSNQISEYSAQENALTEARDVLQQRQAEGIALTEQEQELLNNYPELYERITGGQEDATVQAGLLAAAYIENMKIGDEMNANMQDSTTATGELVSTIERLIASLNGVPPDVETDIAVNGIDAAIQRTIEYMDYLNSIPGYVQTVVETVRVEGAGGETRTRGALHGGVMGYANGGIVAGMAEAGPELLYFRDGGMGVAMMPGLYSVPRGTYVTPAPETKRQLSSGSGGNIHIGVLNIYPETGDIRREITASVVRDWR